MKLSENANYYRFWAGIMQYNAVAVEFDESPQQRLLDRSLIDVIPLKDIDTEDNKRKKRNRLKCHICSLIVTDEDMCIDVLGHNTHVRTNPGGFTYQFRCFRAAPGCSAIGTITSEHTWFAGYAWQIACCRQCGEHLGWLFRGNYRFYGLIQGRIVSDESPH
jgi:hypothetical protein